MKEEDAPPERSTPPLAERQIALGFMFAHSVASEQSRHLFDTASWAFTLGEMLIDLGVIDRAAFEERRRHVAAALATEMNKSGLGVFIDEKQPDKYHLDGLPEVDCTRRLPVCRAACCQLQFPLSRQDVTEGVVAWDLGRPYLNRKGDDGYCVHSCATSRACGVYDQRPAACRRYDCRDDARIWLDFEQMILQPGLARRLAGDE